jgi:hypothetical protein
MASSSLAPARVTPVQADNITAAIERTYRECGTYQWVRETLKNAIEAGATRIEYTLETQALDNLGVYRRLVVDNGCGMSADELRRFFRTFGGGGKPIGGEHENFGMGAKVSLLPWNRHGLVVISLQDGELSMIRMVFNEAGGFYGLLQEIVEDPETGERALDDVYQPFDATDRPEDGCDWRRMVPDFVHEAGHGTVLVLLGNAPDAWTIKGDPNRPEDVIKGIALYLNQRFWRLPDNLEVYVDEVRSWEPEYLPRTSDDWHGSGSKTRRNRRTIFGARSYIFDTERSTAAGKIASQGTARLDDYTTAEWFLWSGQRPQVGAMAPEKGFIAVHYRDELYDFTRHAARFRSFGISDKDVREKLFIIIHPAEFDESHRYGIYPRGDRNAVLLAGGPNTDNSLPMNDWSMAFAESLPDEIKSAIQDARAQLDDVGDTTWMSRLKERFGNRWKVHVRIAQESGNDGAALTASHGDSRPMPRPARSSRAAAPTSGSKPVPKPGTGTGAAVGTRPGPTKARRRVVSGGVPDFRVVRAGEIEDDMLAAWSAHEGECGKVLINVDHEVIRGQIEHWQQQYPPHLADQVANTVIQVYGQLAAAKIAHTEGLRVLYPPEVIEQQFRSPSALTAGLLGLVGEDQIISTRLGGTLGKQRQTVGATTQGRAVAPNNPR